MLLRFCLVLQKPATPNFYGPVQGSFSIRLAHDIFFYRHVFLLLFPLSLLAAIVNFAHHQTTTLGGSEVKHGPSCNRCCTQERGVCSIWWRSHAGTGVPFLIYGKIHYGCLYASGNPTFRIFKECRFSELTTRIRKSICESDYAFFFFYSFKSTLTFQLYEWIK